MLELDYKESRAPKTWCFWTVVLEKTLESPLDCKEIQPVLPKGDQFWVFIGRTDAEVETPILWPLDVKNWLFGKDPDAGKDQRQEKRTTEDHRLDGHELEQAPGFGDGQGSLACSSPWGHKESDTTEWLKWTELGDLQILLYHCYVPKEKQGIILAARAHVEQLPAQQDHAVHQAGNYAVPETHLQWNYQLNSTDRPGSYD